MIDYFYLKAFVCFCAICYGSASEAEDPSVEGHQSEDVNETQFVEQQQPVNIRVPYSSSPLYLTQLAQTEQQIYKTLLQYENQLLQRLDILQRLRRDYESSVNVAMQQIVRPDLLNDWSKASVVSSHPILAFRMIRRFSKDLKAFTDHIWQSLEHELWETLELHRNKFVWPSHDDYIAFTRSLIRLQDTYDFDIASFTDGVIQDHHVQVGLTARQCLEISETALELGEINSAAEWFQAAHVKGVNGQDESVSLEELTLAWERTYQAFQGIWPMEVFTTHDVFKEAKEMLRDDFNRIKKNLTLENKSINFKALCRGENLLDETQIYDMRCYLETTHDPYFFINPLKIELYSWDPLVYQAHDFVGAQAIGNLSFVVVPSMVSRVEDGLDEFQTQDMERTYTHTLLPDQSSPYLTSLNAKIDLLPGIKTLQRKIVISDKYLISAFAVGNHYEPCIQCFADVRSVPEGVRNVGRIASSVDIVLHEPQRGGELAFPMLGVSITPNIGSAIFHRDFNIFGSTDERAIHGACPVLIGEKWIATKLIYEEVRKGKRGSF